MRSFRSSRRNQMRVNAEINITNLVDVAFVLLIIFIITAPILQGGVEINVPDVNAPPLESKETVIVSVTRDGRIFLGDAEVSEEMFGQVFPLLLPVKSDPVFIKGDEDTRYGAVGRVMQMLTEMGYTKMNLVMEPVRQTR